MTTIVMNIIGTAINTALLFVPSRYKTKNFNQVSFPQAGETFNGWTYKEQVSNESGFTHRYYYHPGPDKNAPVFLFLHGLIFDGKNFLNASNLSQKWQLIAYDFPESTSFYRGDMSDFRFLLDDFLDNLKIDSIYLCGVSFGGGIATRYAASHARRVKALVLVSTFIMNATPIDRIKSRQMARVILKHPDYKLFWLMERVFNISFSGKNNPLSELRGMIKIKQLDWYRQAIKAITTCEGPEDAVQIKCPVLALYGSNDKTVSLNSAKSIPEFIPHSRFEIIEGGTHAMMYLQGETISQKIESFCGTLL